MSELCEIDETADGYLIEWNSSNFFDMAGVKPRDAVIVADGQEIPSVTKIYPMRCSLCAIRRDNTGSYSPEMFYSSIQVIHGPSGTVTRSISKTKGGNQ